jgi:hypothetical protein
MLADDVGGRATTQPLSFLEVVQAYFLAGLREAVCPNTGQTQCFACP